MRAQPSRQTERRCQQRTFAHGTVRAAATIHANFAICGAPLRANEIVAIHLTINMHAKRMRPEWIDHHNARGKFKDNNKRLQLLQIKTQLPARQARRIGNGDLLRYS